MNILIITADFAPGLGGIANFVHGIATSMALINHNVSVLTPQLPEAKDKDLPYRVIRYKLVKRFKNLWPSIITLSLCLFKKIDVVIYGHAASTLSVGGIVARKLNLSKLVLLTHGNDLKYTISNRTDKYFLDKLLEVTDLILANSNFTRGVLVNKYDRLSMKTEVLNPGIWLNLLCPNEETPKVFDKSLVILTVSRLVDVKSIDDLIKAFAIVVKIYPRSILKIIGDGPERDRLELLARKLKLERSIIFTGSIIGNEIYCELRRCAIFVLPSKVETFGIAYLEAGACGKAVIGTNQGGVPDAVIDGRTGILVEPGNIKQLADAMIFLLRNKATREKMGRAGRNRIEKQFDWQVVSKKMEYYLNKYCLR